LQREIGRDRFVAVFCIFQQSEGVAQGRTFADGEEQVPGNACLLLDKLQNVRHAQLARLLLMAVSVVDLEATKGRRGLEGDGADGIRMFPREIDHLLYLVGVEAVIERDGQR
jgi:hypothetical protein